MFRFIVPAALFAGIVAAQTFTACNPLNTTCPDDAALGATYNQTFDSTTTALNPKLWNVTSGTNLIQFTDDGAELVISKSGQSVTVESMFYIMFGQVEIMLQAAAGQGIISTFDLLSNDLDEIDVEIMGGNTSFVESNWYGHGNLSQYNAVYHPCQGPQQTMHNYTIIWDKEQIQWLIDGNVARSLPYAPSGKYPQTPSILKFGIWAGGDSTQPEGTVVWAGGKTDWSKGPFTMTIHSIKITDASTNTSAYTYTDRTGTYQSIKATAGQSLAYQLMNKPIPESVAQRWRKLPTGAKIGIAAGLIAIAVLALIAFTVFFVIQRKRGRAEKAAADQAWETHNAEMLRYREELAKEGFVVSSVPAYGEKF